MFALIAFAHLRNNVFPLLCPRGDGRAQLATMYLTFASLQMSDLALEEDILEEEAAWDEDALRQEHALLHPENEPAADTSNSGAKPPAKSAFPSRKANESNSGEEYCELFVGKSPE